MPRSITSGIPSSLLQGTAQRLSVYTYDASWNQVEVPWDQARMIVVDAVRNNGTVIVPSAGMAHAWGTAPLAAQDGAATLEDLIRRYFP